jgi:hypothetical protein
MSAVPKLIEPGVKYFLHKSLQRCFRIKEHYFYIIHNLGFMFIFIGILALFILYKYKHKLSDEEKKAQLEQSKRFLLEKIRKINIQKNKAREEVITNIPKFESSFVQLHKNYYNT